MSISTHPLVAEIFASPSTGFLSVLWRGSQLAQYALQKQASHQGTVLLGNWRNEFETGVQVLDVGKP